MCCVQKSHQGPIVIGERESEPREAAVAGRTEEVNQELEYQFAESLEHKLSGGARAHHGLGFHDVDKETTGQTGDIKYEVSEQARNLVGSFCFTKYICMLTGNFLFQRFFYT